MKISTPEPVPVLAATIVDVATLVHGAIAPTTRILIVVRDATTNVTHPDVVSMPTQRIPFALAESLLNDTSSLGSEQTADAETTYLIGPEYTNLERMVHNPVVYSVVALLTRKLGVTEYLEWHHGHKPRLTFSATVASMTVGHATYSNRPGGRESEYIRMINVLVRIVDGVDLFPSQTSNYAFVRWVDASRFMEAMRDRNPTAIDPRLRLEQYCIHGLCVHGTYGHVTRELVQKH